MLASQLCCLGTWESQEVCGSIPPRVCHNQLSRFAWRRNCHQVQMWPADLFSFVLKSESSELTQHCTAHSCSRHGKFPPCAQVDMPSVNSHITLRTMQKNIFFPLVLKASVIPWTEYTLKTRNSHQVWIFPGSLLTTMSDYSSWGKQPDCCYQKKWYGKIIKIHTEQWNTTMIQSTMQSVGTHKAMESHISQLKQPGLTHIASCFKLW